MFDFKYKLNSVYTLLYNLYLCNIHLIIFIYNYYKLISNTYYNI